MPGMTAKGRQLRRRDGLQLEKQILTMHLMPIVRGRIQDDLPVDQLPFLVVGAIVDEGAERLDRRPVVALQRFVHCGRPRLSALAI